MLEDTHDIPLGIISMKSYNWFAILREL